MESKMLLNFCGSLMLAGFFSACSFGGGDETTIQARSTTGQELIDLIAAYDKGIITERQYEQQKKGCCGGNSGAPHSLNEVRIPLRENVKI